MVTAPQQYLLLFLRGVRMLIKLSWTLLLFIKLCSAFSYVLRTVSIMLGLGAWIRKKLPPFSELPSVLSEWQSFNSQRAVAGHAEQLLWAPASIKVGNMQENEKGSREARFLEQLLWRCLPSAVLGSLQVGLAMGSKSWRTGTEPKWSGQVFFPFALHILDQTSLISEKYWYEIRPPLIRLNRAKDAGFVMLPFGQLLFFRASLEYEGCGRTAVIGVLLKIRWYK